VVIFPNSPAPGGIEILQPERNEGGSAGGVAGGTEMAILRAQLDMARECDYWITRFSRVFPNASTRSPSCYSSGVVAKGRLDVCRMCKISTVSPRTR
jgi:hypothetical protein